MKRRAIEKVDENELKNNVNFWKKAVVIAPRAFSHIKNISEIKVPKNIKIIDNNGFSNCESLEKIVLCGVEKIGMSAFGLCTNLKEVEILSKVKNIGVGAFSNCSMLKSVKLPNRLEYIGESMFNNCFSLEEICIPQSVCKINGSAFEGCYNLKKIEIPSSVKIIGSNAFSGNKKLVNIILNEWLETIDFLAFHHNISLKRIDFPKSLRVIGTHAFLDCNQLETITLNEGLEKIGAESFEKCYELRKINIPGSVKTLEYRTFANCNNLEVVVLNEGLKKIENLVFENCNKITEITIPKSVENIEPQAFNYNRFKFLVIKDDGCVSFSVNKKENEKAYLVSNVFSLFPDIDLSLILKNREKIIDILDKLEEYKETLVTIPGVAIDSYEKLIKVCNDELKIMKKLCDLAPKKVSKINVIDLYKLAHCMGAFESKDVKILINDNSVPVRNFAYTVLQGAFNRGDLSFEDLHMRFQSLKMGEYNEEFLRFMANKTNLNELKQEDYIQPGFSVRVYEWFEERKYINIIESSSSSLPNLEENRYRIRTYDTAESGVDRIKWRAPTVSLLKKEFMDKRFVGVIDERSAELAEYFNGFNLYKQTHFDKALEIDKERKESKISDHITGVVIKENVVDSIEDYKKRMKSVRKKMSVELNEISNKQVDIASKIFTYEMLAKSDKANFAMGLLTSCCATLYGAGAGAQRAMIIHPDIQPMVIRDMRGNICAFGIVYVNRDQGYAVINNFEINNKYACDKEALKEIYIKAMQGVENFVKKYNHENKDNPINVVTCGVSPNWSAINEYIKKHPKSSILEAPNFDDFKYVGSGSWSGDWHKEQYVIWKNR